MANIKISDLTAASVAADANEFEINEAGTSKKVTGSQIKAYVNSADGALASKNTVATADIDNLAVTEAKLADSSVTSAKIVNGTITGTDIATDTITATNIAASAVGASELNVPGNGTSGQYLASDGDGTMTWTTLPAGGGFSNMDVFTAPGTWTNPGNISKVKVTVVGGGGGGGNSSVPANTPAETTGGGGGGVAIEVIPFPTATNVTVTRGAGGGGGSAGGTSSFGAYCSATGGSAGFSWGASNVNTGYQLIGAAGGTGSGGALNVPGERGAYFGTQSVPVSNPNQFKSSAGGGGSSALGFGTGGQWTLRGYNSPAPVNGIPGYGYGGGGGGAVKKDPGGANVTGGSGTAGVIIVEY